MQAAKTKSTRSLPSYSDLRSTLQTSAKNAAAVDTAKSDTKAADKMTADAQANPLSGKATTGLQSETMLSASPSFDAATGEIMAATKVMSVATKSSPTMMAGTDAGTVAGGESPSGKAADASVKDPEAAKADLPQTGQQSKIDSLHSMLTQTGMTDIGCVSLLSKMATDDIPDPNFTDISGLITACATSVAK